MVSKFIIYGKLKLFEIFEQFKFSDFPLLRVELKSFFTPQTTGTAIAFKLGKPRYRATGHYFQRGKHEAGEGR